jgi:formylglycine-generating enzyme required for sulfatase activity
MATVQLLDRTYTLPEIASEKFRHLQEQVRARQRLIQEGVKSQPRLLGLIPRTPVRLSEEERFRELDLLVRDYDAIIAGLREGKAAYEAFFAQIATDVQQAVLRKSDEIRQLEQERATLQASAVTQQDTALEQWARQSEEQLLQSVRLLGQATLLLLKKVALCQEGINRLGEDQELQRSVLAQLMGQLENHRRAYILQQRIERVVHEVAQMAEVALNFEQYMRDHFGPLQGLLEQVVKADANLHKAVVEIEEITWQMLRQSTVPWLGSDTLDQRMLHFLTTSTLKRERLVEVLERIERQDGTEEALDTELATSGSTALSVIEALDNIELLLDVRLTPLVSEPLPSTPLPGPLPALDKLWVNRLGIEFVLIPVGTFAMGSEAQGAVHQVTLSQPFYMSRYAVTQAQWIAVMRKNSSRFQGEHHPVENVSWEDVQEFIRWLNAREGGKQYRLPTEAEWEYAARAGSMTIYSSGDDVSQLGEHAWYATSAGGVTHPVGQLRPNAWGLYDMYGNVWEWVQDWYGAYPTEAVTDPQGPSLGSIRVLRGGSWRSGSKDCRSANRLYAEPGSRSDSIGFRLLRTVP